MKQHLKPHKKNIALHFCKSIFWFFVGAFLGLFLLVSFSYITFQNVYMNKVYPGIYIDDMQISGKSGIEIENYYKEKNNAINKTAITFAYKDMQATVSAKQIELGYDENLIALQAVSIGRSKDTISNISIILQAYITTLHLPITHHFNESKLRLALAPISAAVYKQPVDALFNFQNGRVSAFRLSEDGQDIDFQKLHQQLLNKIPFLLNNSNIHQITIYVPLKVIKPAVSTKQANTYGIKELVGEGTSLFHHSIPSRIYNIALAASRINGILISPNEEFSFDKALGDVSAFTGYKQAYVITNGKTVLGDGGGVCQVSTTLFRTLLNAGLPITERHAHAYRVGYYEEDTLPGFDATIYVPTVDLKFLNNTGHYLLIQNDMNQDEMSLTFKIYGTNDGRKVTLTIPVITNQIPPPAPLYQDDPTLLKGQVEQTDFAASGATVTFSRRVTHGSEVLINETYISNYQPWRAVYLRGTKS